MNRFSEFARRLAMLFRREKFDREIYEEMQLHMELREKDHIANGRSDAEAHMNARKHFGNALALREESRDSWGWAWLEHLLQDLRFAFRMLRKSPGFTAVAVLTLALGIGANTAIFSVVYAVLLRPLPIHDPGRVVVLHDQLPKVNLPRAGVSVLQFRDYSAHSNIFESTALILEKNLNLNGAGQSQRLLAMRATSTLFPLLGIKPILGRTFTAAEDAYGKAHVALLSETVWKDVFGGARDAVGKRIQLDGESYQVIGVLPQSLDVLDPNIQLWIPMAPSPQAFTEDERWTIVCTMLARLRSGVTLKQAQAVMDVDASRIATDAPPEHRGIFEGFRIEVRPYMDEVVGNVRQPLYLLLGAVLLVLLIACANVANLLLARGTVRAREMAIRAAIGAGRRRVIAQLLTESVVLSLAGGVLGVLLAWWGVTALTQFAPASLPHASTIHLDPVVLGFTLIVSMLAGIFFGVAPAMQASKIDLNDALKENARGSQLSSARRGLRSALVLSEIALTFVLLTGSGLLLKSFARLLDVNPGFNPTNVLTMQLSPSENRDAAQTAAVSRVLLDRVFATPGVLYAALADEPPLMEPDNSLFVIRSYRPGSDGPQPHADNVSASPDYFAAMGISLLRGHIYTKEETRAGSVAVIDQALANRFWPGTDPIGKQLGFDEKGPWATIVGIVSTVRSHTLETESNGTIYFPGYGDTLVVRTASDPRLLAGALRTEIEAVDSGEAVYNVKTMSERVAESAAQQRFATGLLALFAVLALVLAAVGLYSVMAYVVTQRTHEIGVRMALGAQRSSVLRLVIGQGLTLAGIGIVVGLAAALGLTRLMSSLLYGVSATDPATLVGVAFLLLVMAMLACYVPARRAMCVDPMVALRYE